MSSPGAPPDVMPSPLLPAVGLAYLILQIAPGASDIANAARDGNALAPAIWQTVRDCANVGVVGAIAAFLWHVRSPAKELLAALTGLVVQLRDTLPRLQELAARHDTQLAAVVQQTTRIESIIRSRHGDPDQSSQ